MNNNEIIAKYLPANTDIKIHNNFLTFEITHALLKRLFAIFIANTICRSR